MVGEECLLTSSLSFGGSCVASFIVQPLCHRLKWPGLIFKVVFLRTIWGRVQRLRKKSVSTIPKILTPILSLARMLAMV